MVVLGHWLMVVLTPDGEITNALTIVAALQPLTWLLQVMPLFFLVGGVAHSYALDSLDRRVPPGSPGRYAAFFRARGVRLLRPSLAFLAVWVALGIVAHVSGLTARPGVQGRFARDALVAVPQLLWFVGIYLGACAFAPLMRSFHERWGPYAAGLLVGLAVLVDVARFTAAELVGNLNFVFVWLAFHQLGFLWRDGRLTRRAGWTMVVGGYGAMLIGDHRRALPDVHGGVARRADLQHGSADRGPARPGCRDLRSGRARAADDEPGALPAPGLAGGRARCALCDDGLPVAPDRADGRPARDAGARRGAAGGGLVGLVADASGSLRRAGGGHRSPGGGLRPVRPRPAHRDERPDDAGHGGPTSLPGSPPCWSSSGS